MPELNVGPFPAKFPYRNEFEPNHNINNDISNNNNRKRNGDDVFQGENTVKKVTGRRGRPVKGTGYEGSPDILGGNRIYDSNNMNNNNNVHNMSNFRNNGDTNNDRNNGNGNYSSENHGNHGNRNQLPESTLYRVDSNGNYEAVINTNNIIQPKILKKPRKSNINNPKTIKISKNKKDLMNNNLSISDEDGKNIQNDNLGSNLNSNLGLNQSQNRGEIRGEKTEINAMDALFWALDHDQQENDKLKQLEKDKEREREREREREKEVEKGENDDNTVNIDENFKENGEEKSGNEHKNEKVKVKQMCSSNESNSNNVILTESKEMIGVKENEKMEERGDEEEKVGGEKERRETENENDKMDTELN